MKERKRQIEEETEGRREKELGRERESEGRESQIVR